MNNKIFVIILNYNSWKDTIECIDSVLKSNYPNFQVVVLDNNSLDNSINHIKNWAKKKINYVFFYKNEFETLCPSNYEAVFGTKLNQKVKKYPLVLIQNEENRGFAAGNNVFLRFLLKNNNDCFVFLLNPDTTIEVNSLNNLVECANKDKKAIYGVNIYDYFEPKKEIIKGGFKITHYGTVEPIRNENLIFELDFISGSAMFCHINVFKEVGLLPEEYFLYWEDADWCIKAKRQGLKLLLCNNTKIHDKHGKSVGGREKAFSEYYYTLNLFKFYQKYFPEKKNKMYFWTIIRGLKKFLQGNFSVALTIFKAVIKSI